MEIKRVWAMPSRWTFTIKPIKELLEEEMGSGMFLKGYWCDPFAGINSQAQETNDLNPKRKAKYCMEAMDFLKMWGDETFDGVLFDPPYSPSQVKECYENIGINCTSESTKQSFYSEAKNEITRILKPNGKVISFGWNSNGLGINRGFTMERILIVPHGGAKNDTIVTVEIFEKRTVNNARNKYKSKRLP